MNTAQQNDSYRRYTRYARSKRLERDAIVTELCMSGVIRPQGSAGGNGEVDQLGFIAGVLSRAAGTQQTAFEGGVSSSSSAATGVSLMERQVQRAISQVMGRGANSPDTFIAALNDTFPTNQNGRVAAVPSRSVISMLGLQNNGSALTAAGLAGQISIEQANLYRQASIIGNDALLVLQGIQPFSPQVNLSQMEALRSLISTSLRTLLEEFGRVDEPRRERVASYFSALGFQGAECQGGGYLTEFGKAALLDCRYLDQNKPSRLSDEGQIAAYELLKGYAKSLFEIWSCFEKQFYPKDQPGTASLLFSDRLARANVLISVLGEGNRNFMSALDSIGFTENERRSKATEFSRLERFAGFPLPHLTVNDLNEWLERFTSLEAPAILTDSGRYGLAFVTQQADKLFWTLVPIIAFIRTADRTTIGSSKPVLLQALLHERVTWSLDDMLNQLQSLADLAA